LFNNIKYYITTFRPIVSGISLFTALFYLVYHHVPQVTSYVSCIAIFLITGIGFVFNDLYDMEKDKLANKDRPICTGKFATKDAKKMNLFVSILCLGFACLSFNKLAIGLIVLTYLLVYIYSPFSKKYSLFKGSFTALLCVIPIVYGQLVANIVINYFAITLIFVFIVGREILLDVYDFRGDMKARLKTLPALIGVRRSYYFSWAFMFFSSVLYFFMTYNNPALLAVACCCFTLLCICVQQKNNQKLNVTLTRIIMLIVALSVSAIGS
jgi:4-hydroxybenzoate polyprenyltransferase